MKIKSINLKNYKKFKEQKIDFIDKNGKIMDMVVIVGNNGNGKSSVLQTIASMLGTATQRLKSPAELDWEGFNYDLICKFKPKPAQIELEMEFSETEIEATQEYYKRCLELFPDSFKNTVLPSNDKNVKLKLLDYKEKRVGCASRSNYFQFRGYSYAKQLFDHSENQTALYDKVGNIFWYKEQRTSSSLMNMDNEIQHYDLDLLRQKLIDFEIFNQKAEKFNYQLREGQRNFYQELRKKYQLFFPDNDFIGLVPESEQNGLLTSKTWFYIEDNDQKLQYELSEMSAGERALFPLIWDFANWNINNSIILIDEAELHLHPPLQQTLMMTLPKLGKNNQFIITTHSNTITSCVTADQIKRL